MVGRSVTDIATARAAGIPVIAVDFGYTETPVASSRPDRVISRFADLPEAVFDLLGAAGRIRQRTVNPEIYLTAATLTGR